MGKHENSKKVKIKAIVKQKMNKPIFYASFLKGIFLFYMLKKGIYFPISNFSIFIFISKRNNVDILGFVLNILGLCFNVKFRKGLVRLDFNSIES